MPDIERLWHTLCTIVPYEKEQPFDNVGISNAILNRFKNMIENVLFFLT